MLIECGGCPARGRACAGCAVGVLLSLAPPRRGEVCLDLAEQAAVDAFLRAGLVAETDAEGFVALLDDGAVAV